MHTYTRINDKIHPQFLQSKNLHSSQGVQTRTTPNRLLEIIYFLDFSG